MSRQLNRLGVSKRSAMFFPLSNRLCFITVYLSTILLYLATLAVSIDAAKLNDDGLDNNVAAVTNAKNSADRGQDNNISYLQALLSGANSNSDAENLISEHHATFPLLAKSSGGPFVVVPGKQQQDFQLSPNFSDRLSLLRTIEAAQQQQMPAFTGLDRRLSSVAVQPPVGPLPPGFGERYFDFDKRAAPFYAMRGKKAAFYAMRGKKSDPGHALLDLTAEGDEANDDKTLSHDLTKRSPLTWLSRAFSPRDAYEHMYQAERSWYNPHLAMSSRDADGNNNSGGHADAADANNNNYAVPPQYKRAMFFAMRG